jgi:hypothetical protein
MLFKYFTDKDSKISIAVNPNNVLCVKEVAYGTTICFVDSSYITVTEAYLETVTRLSEK